MIKNKKIAVIIPCYRVVKHIGSVIGTIPDFVDAIYAVDDCCDQESGRFIQENIDDPRLHVIFHQQNTGVGGAMVSGYKHAIIDGMDIAVKIDGDGQMDPSLITRFVMPIVDGDADYTKGNRFYNLSDASSMPKIRLFGNMALSFLTKLSSGYWNIFDPTNGYTAISVPLLKMINLDKLSKRYFFESDILYRIGIAMGKVIDIPMTAVYGDEVSNLKISKIFWPFLKGNFRNMGKRIIYKYYIQDVNIASLQLLFGFIFLIFGLIYGGSYWYINAASHTPTPSGTVILSALCVAMGFQLLLAFLSYDTNNYPKDAISKRIN